MGITDIIRKIAKTSEPTCPICHGSGTEEPRVCDFCEGKGRIYQQQMVTIKKIAQQATKIQSHNPDTTLNVYQRAALSLFPEYQTTDKQKNG